MTNDAIGEAAQDIGDELAPDIAFIQPVGTSHLVSEAVLLAAGSAVLGAFGAGLLSAAKGQAKEWGEQVGAWLGDRFRRAFSDHDQAADDQEATDSLRSYAELVVKVRVEDANGWFELVESTVVSAMVEQGLPQSRAELVAHVAKERTVAITRGTG